MTEVLSFRVDETLKKAIAEQLGDYRKLEPILEELFLGGKLTTEIVENKETIKKMERIEKKYLNMYEMLEKTKEKIIDVENEILIELNNINDEKDNFVYTNETIKTKIEQSHNDFETRLNHSINEVTKMAEFNQQEREKHATTPIKREVVQRYAELANVSTSQLISYLPDDLQKCID